ncbi:MAG: hypothetical protein JO063_01930 [Pseudonocardiales bacterium]|nr:hypothetical protein [Pseudonocardiales bacterium]MBV9031229.1 hypothetical protein [Pseudonocardiales bacterium]MBW0008873.1 hypothetical protein [Pseudonocardiales bacterium]
MSATVVEQLDSLRAHLAAFELPDLCSVNVVTASGEPGVSAQLAAHHPPQIATGLLAWADTLTDLTIEAWRVPSGDSVHLSVIGRLPEGVTVRVYGGLAFTQRGIGADLAPEGSATVPLAVLRHLAIPGEVTL